MGDRLLMMRGVLVTFLLFFGSLIFLVNIPQAKAAGITFNASTTFSLTGTGDSLTIAGGSTASSTVVNAGNIVITMQNGNIITVSVTNKNLTPTGHSSNAVITRNTLCYTNVSNQQAIITLTATQNESVTLTPAACPAYESGAKAGAAGSQATITYTSTAGSASDSSASTVPATPAPAPTPKTISVTTDQTTLTQIVQELNDIQRNLSAPDAAARLLRLQASLQALLSGNQSQPSSGVSSGSAVPPSRSYSRPLGVGSKGDEVKALQRFLKDRGAGIYPEGSVTGYFGPSTRKAVGKFQLQNGIVKSARDPGYGYVGPKTRDKINSLLGL